MGFSFDRPTGPTADVLELEYVSTLMQTDIEVRQKISAEDIALLLKSRHGVDVSAEQVNVYLLEAFTNPTSSAAEPTDEITEMSRSENSDSERYLDMVELVALLIIPQLMEQRRNDCQQQECENVNPKFICQKLLHNILHDTLDDFHADKGSTVLTKSLVSKILNALGETEMAKDKALIKEMVRAVANAPSSSNDQQENEHSDLKRKSKPKITAETFYYALIGDLVDEYDSAYFGIENDGKEDDDSEYGEDQEESKATTTADEDAEDAAEQNVHPRLTKPIRSAPFLDFAADRFSSRTLITCQWVFFMMSFFTYYSGIGTFVTSPECEGDQVQFRPLATWSENAMPILCTIRWSILRWLYIITVMSCYGIVYFGLTGLGSLTGKRSSLWTLIGAISAWVFTVLPLFIDELSRDNMTVDVFLKVATSLFGLFVILNILWLSFLALLRDFLPLFYERYKSSFLQKSSKAGNEIKKAGIKKMNTVIQNSFNMHSDKLSNLAIKSHQGQALLNYSYTNSVNDSTEKVGGFQWTWKKLRSGDLVKEEGLWYSGRLISVNASQFLLSMFILVFGLSMAVMVQMDYRPPDEDLQNALGTISNLSPDIESSVEIISRAATTATTFLDNNSSTEACADTDLGTFKTNCTSDDLDACREASGSWLCAIVFYNLAFGTNASTAVREQLLEFAAMDFISSVDQTSAQSIYPAETYMLVAPLVIGTLVAFVTALTVSFSVVPSMTTTMLKLRSGIISITHDPRIRSLRHHTGYLHYLRGAQFWGTIFSSFLMGSFVGLILFLMLYQNTSFKLQHAVASLVGLGVVTTLHFLFVFGCQRYSTKGFYRKRPLGANLDTLAKECAYLALTVGFTLIRVFKLLAVTILFVGRLDIPFLSPGVAEYERFNYKFDDHPYLFLTDILQHEAHRHPYIELFTGVCLLKLDKGNQFINRAGSAWRLVFLLSLMPWLAKYRQSDRELSMFEDEEEGQSIDELKHQLKHLKARLKVMNAQVKMANAPKMKGTGM